MNVRWGRQVILSFCLSGVGFTLADELTFTAYDMGNLGCTEPPNWNAVAYDINHVGVLVGLSGPPTCQDIGHGISWFNGVMTDVAAITDGPVLASAIGISRYGTMVGSGNEVVPRSVEFERLSHISNFLSTPLLKDIQPGPSLGPTPPSTGASAYSL